MQVPIIRIDAKLKAEKNQTMIDFWQSQRHSAKDQRLIETHA
jgi:hypothetical protein